MPRDKDPQMREAFEAARALIAAQAEAVAGGNYGLTGRQVSWAVIGRERDELVKLIEALVRLGSMLAAVPSQAIDDLGRDSVPTALVERYGDPLAALQLVWLLVEQSQARE